MGKACSCHEERPLDKDSGLRGSNSVLPASYDVVAGFQ